jgi:hypothetical protein
MSEFDFASEYEAFGDDLKGVAYNGDYDMLVTKMKYGTTAKGKAMFTVTLAFTSGPYKAKGKTLDDRLYWSPENETAARIFSQALRVLGASQEWIMAERPTPEQIAERCVGNVVSVRLKEDEFNNQKTTRVTYQKTVSSNQAAAAATGGNGAPPSAAQAVSLDDDDDDADTPTGEPVTAGVGASGDDANPWG